MKKAVMYGAGNIGRGFIGQLLSQSDYEVVFLDINAVVIDRLNQDGCYPLRLVSAGKATETTVENVRGVNSMNAAAAAAEIATADLLATAVGANILPRIAPVIAEGLRQRWQAGNTTPLNIIICENLMDAHKVLEQLLLKNLEEGFHPALQQRVGFVEASIGRMVPVTTEAMQEGNPTRVWAEPYAELPVDREGFRGELPAIVGLKPFAPFRFFIERKLYMHNMSHAILAYLGHLADYEFVWEAVRDRHIAAVARAALAESAEALSKKHGVPPDELAAFCDDLMVRFDNTLLGDTVARVGRDPVRKLAFEDRLAGAAFTCLDQGILPEHICRGIAAALLFTAEGDRAADEVQACVRDFGPEAALAKYCGIGASSPLLPIILKNYNELSSK